MSWVVLFRLFHSETFSLKGTSMKSPNEEVHMYVLWIKALIINETIAESSGKSGGIWLISSLTGTFTVDFFCASMLMGSHVQVHASEHAPCIGRNSISLLYRARCITKSVSSFPLAVPSLPWPMFEFEASTMDADSILAKHCTSFRCIFQAVFPSA